MKSVLIVILVVIVGILAGLVTIYSGWIDVAATTPDTGLKAWVLNETMVYSVKHHAKDIQTPSLKVPAMIQRGLRSYDQMCAGCHGAPGRERGGRGFNPAPPSLAAVVEKWKPQEVFWITKYGIKMTAMRAFGGERMKDQDIWAVVAFLQTLPDVTPERYVAVRDSMRAAEPPDTTRRR
jgi:mono/diheme cytochrome c family protein